MANAREDAALCARLEFEARVARHALLGGVRPSAVQFVVPLASERFELRDDALKVKDGETDPHDPLAPLSFEAWLWEFRKEHEFLFVPT